MLSAIWEKIYVFPCIYSRYFYVFHLTRRLVYDNIQKMILSLLQNDDSIYIYSIKPIFLKVERWMSSHWLIYSYIEKFVEMLVAYVDVTF